MEAKTVEINLLREFEGNPRKGNVAKLVESLKTNGQYKPIVVQKSTNQILAGNHLWKAAKELNWQLIDVVYADVDDEAAKKIVAADNRLGELGTYDEQALLDLFTMHEHFEGKVEGKKIAIIGDVKSSRVAGSNRKLLPRFGMDVCFIAPECFRYEASEYKQYAKISEVIDELDVIMSLRTQLERHSEVYFESLNEYAKDYCVTKEVMGDRNILLLHPGPVNRNVDISDEMLKDPRSKVLEQVTNGVAIRAVVS